jgi:hypothetical protein
LGKSSLRSWEAAVPAQEIQLLLATESVCKPQGKHGKPISRLQFLRSFLNQDCGCVICGDQDRRTIEITSNFEERRDTILRRGVPDIPMEDAAAKARTNGWGPFPILYSIDRDTERTQTTKDAQCPVMMGAQDEYGSANVCDVHECLTFCCRCPRTRHDDDGLCADCQLGDSRKLGVMISRCFTTSQSSVTIFRHC